MRLWPRQSRRCSSAATAAASWSGPGPSLVPPLARLGVDLTYWRNRMVYTSLTQPPFLSEEFPTASQGVVLPREQCVGWDPPASGTPVESEHQPGLWLLRGALSTAQCRAVAGAVRTLTREHAVQGDGGVPVRPPCSPFAFGPEGTERRTASAEWEWFKCTPLPTPPGPWPACHA